MLKIGLVGVGHFGKVHINCINQTKNFDLTGFYDIDELTRNEVSKNFKIKPYSSYEQLLEDVDVIDIVTPATSHFDCILKALEKNKHVFVEKPMVVTLEQAETIKNQVKEKGIKFQIGHVERFNPSFYQIKPLLNKISYIETNRHSKFKNRNTDVSVIHDLMIHDLDIILNLVDSVITDVRAKGANIYSKNIDIANARIEFANGVVASVNSSRLASNNIRKTLIYTDNSFFTIDYNKKVAYLKQIEKVNSLAENKSKIVETHSGELLKFETKKIIVPVVNSVVEELKSFYNSIINNSLPVVSVEDGFKTIKLANQIVDYINNTIKIQ